MSVIVKGMNMPKNCFDCELCYDYICCMATGSNFWRKNSEVIDPAEERMPNCPLIELHEHGDLIDRDALKAKSVFVGDAFTGTGGYAVWGNDLLDSPVVIPAERKE